jgi:hypothetical protein
MAIPTNAKKEYYTEAEAAQALNISLPRLRQLLNEHVFNDGKARPEQLSLRLSDVILLEFWDHCTPNPKVVRMPRRA